MSSRPNPQAEPARVTIYGKRVVRVEARLDQHYAVFEDGTDLAISQEAYQRIAERLRGNVTTSPKNKNSTTETQSLRDRTKTS